MKFDTIKKRKDIEKLRKEGKRYAGKYLILYILPGQEEHPGSRAVFVVSRKIGKAVIRNKARRVLKEVLRKVLIIRDVDILIIAKNNMPGADFSELKEELENSIHSFLSGQSFK